MGRPGAKFPPAPLCSSRRRAKKPGRKPKLDSTERQLLAAHKENARLKHKLAVANAVIGLQKKAHQVLGLTLPDLGELEEPEES